MKECRLDVQKDGLSESSKFGSGTLQITDSKHFKA